VCASGAGDAGKFFWVVQDLRSEKSGNNGGPRLIDSRGKRGFAQRALVGHSTACFRDVHSGCSDVVSYGP